MHHPTQWAIGILIGGAGSLILILCLLIQYPGKETLSPSFRPREASPWLWAADVGLTAVGAVVAFSGALRPPKD